MGRLFAVISCLMGLMFVVPMVLSAAPPQLGDNTWQPLALGSSSRFVTPEFRVTPTAVTDPNPRTRSYSGLVGGGGKIFWFGGGHNSYPGNDIETFEPAFLSWRQSYEPEVCPYDPAAPCYDIYKGWGTTLRTPLGRPYVGHTYQSYAYDRPRNRLVSLQGSGTWAYDLASQKWTPLAGPYAGNTFSPGGYGMGDQHLLSYDERLGAIQAVVTQGEDRGTYILNAASGRWTKRGGPPERGGATLYSTYAADRDVHFVLAPAYWSRMWWEYKAQADRWTPLPDPPNVPDSFDYDTLNRVVVGVQHNTDGFRVVVFDPDTRRWSALPVNEPIPAQRDGLTGTPMAWRYVTSLNAFVFVEGDRGTSAGGPTKTWIYRYRNARGEATSGVPLARGPSPSPAVDASSSPPAPSPVSAPVRPLGGGVSFAQRCAMAGVVRCFGFDSDAEVAPYVGAGTARPVVDTSVKASGGGSLKMIVPSRSGANTSGFFAMNFTPGSLNRSPNAYPAQFGEGEEFYVQWRQRFAPGFIITKWAGGGGWKQIVIGEGDRPGEPASSCTQIELVVNNSYYQGFPQMYHSCGTKDGRYEGLHDVVDRPGRTTQDYRLQNAIDGCLYTSPTVPPCVGYKPDQWMTFQIHVKIGTWYKNDKKYRRDSAVELWVAEEGQTSRLVISKLRYDLVNLNPTAKYGKVWLMPYNTGKDDTVAYPETYTWYDELIVSRTRIPDP